MGISISYPSYPINKDEVIILPNNPDIHHIAETIAASPTQAPFNSRPGFWRAVNNHTLNRREEMYREYSAWSPRIDILLIGKTGNGKSFTANTIVGQKRFSIMSSENQEIDYHITEHRGRRIKVVDGITVSDTRLDNERSVEHLIEAAKLALAANPKGYHAFLLVLKYGNKFTREEQETVQVLKKIFGDNFFRDYGILIITCGDIFYEDQKAKGSDGLTFTEWLHSQDGAFKDLLDECDFRVILWNNTSIYKTVIEEREALITTINMLFCVRRYDLSGRIQEIKNSYLAHDGLVISGDASEAAKPILDLLHVPQGSSETDDSVPPNKSVRHTTTDQEILAKQEELSGALQDLTKTLESLQKQVSDESTRSQRYAEEIKQYRQHEEEMKNKFEKELKDQREKYESLIEELKQDHQKRFDDIEKRMQEMATQTRPPS